MKELPNTQLIFLVGFAHVTSLAYFENPSNCNYSIMRPFKLHGKSLVPFSFHAFLSLVHIAKSFKEVFPCEQ